MMLLQAAMAGGFLFLLFGGVVFLVFVFLFTGPVVRRTPPGTGKKISAILLILSLSAMATLLLVFLAALLLDKFFPGYATDN